MTNPNKLIVAGLIAGALALSGCGKSESSPQSSSQGAGSPGGASMGEMDFGEPAPSRPAPSLAQLKLHEKVQFPEERFPQSDEAKLAVAAFANSLAAGDMAGLTKRLSARDQAVLQTLVDSGQWEHHLETLKVVRVCVLSESGGAFQLGLGVEDDKGAYLTAWEATGSGDEWTFSSLSIDPRLGIVAADLDGAEIKLFSLEAVEEQLASAAPAAPEPVPDEKKPDEKKKKKPANDVPSLRKSKY
ncbi:MAG: hypothetical protein SFZ24_04065 [Planctomycetota bacterium]|nr:hypothetical protein [Planctomycetota bacterium]